MHNVDIRAKWAVTFIWLLRCSDKSNGQQRNKDSPNDRLLSFLRSVIFPRTTELHNLELGANVLDEAKDLVDSGQLGPVGEKIFNIDQYLQAIK